MTTAVKEALANARKLFETDVNHTNTQQAARHYKTLHNFVDRITHCSKFSAPIKDKEGKIIGYSNPEEIKQAYGSLLAQLDPVIQQLQSNYKIRASILPRAETVGAAIGTTGVAGAGLGGLSVVCKAVVPAVLAIASQAKAVGGSLLPQALPSYGYGYAGSYGYGSYGYGYGYAAATSTLGTVGVGLAVAAGLVVLGKAIQHFTPRNQVEA